MAPRLGRGGGKVLLEAVILFVNVNGSFRICLRRDQEPRNLYLLDGQGGLPV